MTYPRYIKPKLLRSLTASPIILLTGGRQTGKTTLVKELGTQEGWDFITLDNLRLLNGAKSDPMGLLEQYPSHLIIDEIQRAPELALPLKLKVDENRAPGMYILTGSSNPLVAPRLNDSLAGRMFIHHLWPLSQTELKATDTPFLEMIFAPRWASRQYERWKREEMTHALIQGGYPSVQKLPPDLQEEWFNNHLRTLLERDIQDLAQIRKLDEIPNLLQLLAHRSGSLLNIAELSRTTGIPSTTLSFYLTLLEALFLIIRQPGWHKNPTKKMTKNSKVYVTDSGLMAYLIGADEKRILTEPGLIGKFVESFVVLEIEKLISWSTLRLSSYHYRTATGIEVDLVLENKAGELVGIEIKSSETIHSDDFKGLRHLKEEMKSLFLRGIVLYPGNDVIAFGENLYALPMSALWS